MTLIKQNDQHQRIAILDQMRGIVLLGIFLANVPGLSSVDTENLSPVNEVLRSLEEIILSDSTRPLFAFMFGLSLMLLYNRLKAKEINPYPMLFRRLFLLTLVGAVHGYAIWSGDILLMYGMAGFVLLLFMDWSAAGLVMTAFLFWIVYTIGSDVISYFSSYHLSLEDGLKGLLPDSEQPPTGTEYLIIEFSSMVAHIGFFLFGMYAYRKGLFTIIEKRRTAMGLLAVICLVIGLAGKISLYDRIVLHPLENFYPFVVTIGMILCIVLLGTSKTSMSKLLVPFTSVGKMAFTNYLLQSIVFVSLFQSSGRTIFINLGIWQEPSYAFALGIGVILFAVQMIFSHFWLKAFRYGPFEWLWRIGTYGKMVSIKRREETE
ncbi:DUF418 domain-containing protein [Oceanobacillus timonensis]|uniref:DUF418 domain-containing protein n=1 Tax=Oceanobacillus timonensis TaxID=1926285 RepID=UPI0009B9DC47|nr:DUF418 domain-containing protein [Oceanobacillus timonensis]